MSGGYIIATRGKESGKYSMISGIYICKLNGSVMKRLSESSWIEKKDWPNEVEASFVRSPKFMQEVRGGARVG